MHTQRQPPAFTLIELLIVVAIIGILAAVAVPNLLNAQVRANLARVQADFNSIRKAMEMYRVDAGSYPRGGYTDYLQLRHLTTPIAYMSVMPVDVFWPPSLNGPDRPYWYGACVGRMTFQEILRAGKKGAVNQYVLYSSGPDLAISSYSVWEYPKMSSFVTYKMTNGLRSNGDIFFESTPGHQQPPLEGPAFNPMEPIR